MDYSYTKAVWESNADALTQTYSPLTQDIEVDVAIVGAGITGLSTAACLKESGKKVVVLEALQVGKGTTGSSTGNLYAPIDERLFSIENKHNEDALHNVVDSRMSAIAQIERWVKEYGIDCEFKRVPWHLFTTSDTDQEDDQVTKEYKAVSKTSLRVSNVPDPGFPIKNVSAITTIANQAQFNPLKYIQGLAAAIVGENCRIHENTKVTAVEDGEICTVHANGIKIKAKKVVMATHSPKGIYGVHTAMESYREYAIAVKLKGSLPEGGVYWHAMSSQQYSLRPYSNEKGNFLIVLGEPHKVGAEEHNENNFGKIEKYLRKHFDVEAVVYTWAAQQYKPADNLPYIGTSPLEKNVSIATGFAADGLVYGTLAGIIISDNILGKVNPFASLYDPKRFTPVASASGFLKENATVAGHLIKDYLFYGQADELKEIKNGEGKTLKLNDERVAAFRDESGELHIVSAICTHMGCVVHWNNGEKSWDCPCHGSRFSVDGEVLEGPAYKNLSKPEKNK